MNGTLRFQLTWKNIHWAWSFPYLLLVALGCMALCSALKTECSFYQEKMQPCQLSVGSTTQQSLGVADVTQLSSLDDVQGVSGIYEIPITVTEGNFTAEFTAVGIDSAYLDLKLEQGTLFPESSSMPWLMICKEIVDATRDADGNHWTLSLPNAQVTMTANEAEVPAGICGIFQQDDTEITAYLELSQAKKLLEQQGSMQGYDAIWVRCSSFEVSQTVTDQITALGYYVEETDSTQQENWASKSAKSENILIVGFLLLVSAALWQRGTNAKSMEERQKWQTALQWMGLTRREIRSLEMLQFCSITLVGAVIGILVAVFCIS